MQITDEQVRKLMEEMHRDGRIGVAAARAGMDRKTARKYLSNGKLPSEMSRTRDWRTRTDPFAEDWPELVQQLKDAPELEAKTVFEVLCERKPDKYHEGQLRTLQRRIKQWRAEDGPDKEVFFPQEHQPGEAMQTDFTNANKLCITIQGEPFPHLLCHEVLPYSNWEWATVCRSESLLALRRGVQAAVFRLGRVPDNHQTDNSTAATHSLSTGKRGFNDDYVDFMNHLGMKPRTIGVGKSEQNGDVESLNGALKRRLEQHLLLRGNRDFESVEEYETWLHSVLEKANRPRQKRLNQELAVMRPLNVKRLVEYSTVDATVTSWSTVRIKHNAYSVPSRLIGEKVRVRLYDDRLEIDYGSQHQLTVERLLGRHGHRIDYRHVIASLVRKPWGFVRYRYREDLFPSLVFRRLYDRLCDNYPTRWADLEYLRVLELAATTLESDVEAAVELLFEQGGTPSSEEVKALVAPTTPQVPELAVPEVDLSGYDELLELAEEVSA